MNFTPHGRYLRQKVRCDIFRNADVVRFIKFAAVGASGMFVDLACFGLLIPSMGLAAARAVAICIAMTWNYELNRRVTFTEPTGLNVFAGYVRFCAACFLGAGLSWSISILFTTLSEVLRSRPMIAAIIGTGVAAIANYTLCRLWVFSQRQSVSSGTSLSPDDSMGRVIAKS